MGRDDGVVLNCLDSNGAGYWNRYGRLAALSESAAGAKLCDPSSCPCRELMEKILKGEGK